MMVILESQEYLLEFDQREGSFDAPRHGTQKKKHTI